MIRGAFTALVVLGFSASAAVDDGRELNGYYKHEHKTIDFCVKSGPLPPGPVITATDTYYDCKYNEVVGYSSYIAGPNFDPETDERQVSTEALKLIKATKIGKGAIYYHYFYNETSQLESDVAIVRTTKGIVKKIKDVYYDALNAPTGYDAVTTFYYR